VPAPGTPVGIGSNSASSVGNTLAITVGTAVAVGEHVVGGCGASASGVPTGVTDSRGNTYQLDRTDATLRANGMFSSKITTALQVGDTITITYTTSASGVRLAWAARSPGLDQVTWVDKTNAASGTAAAWNGGATGVLTQADEIVYGSGYHATTGTSTPATNYTELYDFVLTHVMSAVYRIVAATTSETPGGTWSSSGSQSDAVGVAYRAAGAAAPAARPPRPVVVRQAVMRAAVR
jgi:hypothetical protein